MQTEAKLESKNANKNTNQDKLYVQGWDYVEINQFYRQEFRMWEAMDIVSVLKFIKSLFQNFLRERGM